MVFLKIRSFVMVILLYYQLQGTRIVDESHDQDTTDLHKCIAFIADNYPATNKSNVR